MIYLDNAATSFPKPSVVYDKMDEANRNCAVNAGRGSYILAKKASDIIASTRLNIARLIGVLPEDVFFAPSDTYAFNMIIGGLDWNCKKNVYVTPFEHNAVMRTLQLKIKLGLCNLFIIPFHENYELDTDELQHCFSSNPPDYIFLNHASNVTGAIIPIKEISTLAKPYRSIITLDAAQTIGGLDLKKVRDYVDFIAFAGHKSLQGPIGIGGFINVKGIPLNEILAGGNGSDSLNLNMPESGNLKFEIGSPNILSFAGLNAGLEWLTTIGINNIATHKEELIKYLVEELKQFKNIHIFPINEESYKIGVLSFCVEGYESSDVGQILNDEFDIAVRTGFHCAPYIHDYIDDKKYGGTVRVSVGYFNSKSDIDRLISAIRSL